MAGEEVLEVVRGSDECIRVDWMKVVCFCIEMVWTLRIDSTLKRNAGEFLIIDST